MKYSDSPDRKYRRVTRISLTFASPGGSPSVDPSSPASCSAFRRSSSLRSSNNDTSAIPRGPNSALPLKTTSSMAVPRRCFGLCSPSTHRMASTMFDLPQPFGPTIAVTPGGSSRTVRSMNDLKPFSSICLIRIRAPSPPASGAPPRFSIYLTGFEGHVTDPAQERHPRVVATLSVRLCHERRPLWAKRLPQQAHPGFHGRPATLHTVAAMTRADDVLPHRCAAARTRQHVVQVQLRAWQLAAAILTPILIPQEDVVAAEPNVSSRHTIVRAQEDHTRHADGGVHQPDRLVERRQ